MFNGFSLSCRKSAENLSLSASRRQKATFEASLVSSISMKFDETTFVALKDGIFKHKIVLKLNQKNNSCKFLFFQGFI